MKTIIIAEAGVNHNGSVDNAKKLIDAAKDAGADYVKFQTWRTEKVVTRTAKRAKYQEKNIGNNESQYEMLKKLELTEEEFLELHSYCGQVGINFLSTPFDLESVDFLKTIIHLAKIPSGEITNLPYLRKMAQTFSEIVLSTGMAEIFEIQAAIDIILKAGIKKENITILHCNTEYPTPMEDVNLKAMLHIKEVFNVNVGYSDHTLGIEVPIAAVALGASVIEKHFTLDRAMEGPDHAASLEPQELKLMVRSIRNIEEAINGSGKKEPSKSEKKNKKVARKSIVASRQIKKGEVFSTENLAIKRPGEGLSPMLWDDLIGRKAHISFNEDEYISLPE